MSGEIINYTFGTVTPKQGKRQDLPGGEYRMKQKKHGCALILNFMDFKGSSTSREGSDKDAKNMGTLLGYLGYDVKIHDNLDYDNTIHILRKYGTMDHSNHDSFVCCIFSHGQKGGKVVTTDNQTINVQKITDLFNGRVCPSLHGKPKIFFTQACRGAGVQCLVPDLGDKFMKEAVTPATADFVFCYATPEAYMAWRQPKGKGSYFIEEICRAFTEHAKYACFFDMMQVAIQRVAEKGKITDDGVENPEITSSLRRHIFFF